MKVSGNQRLLLAVAKDMHLPVPVCELPFHPTRKWRFDVAWPDQRVAIEIEGGAFIGGRHTRGIGYEKDLEKYAAALLLGLARAAGVAQACDEWTGDDMGQTAAGW